MAVFADFLNTLDFKRGKSKFSALISGKNYTFNEDTDGHFRTKSEPSKICKHLIVFESASDCLI